MIPILDVGETPDTEKLNLDIKDIRKIKIGVIKSFHDCDISMNGTSLAGYAIMKAMEDGISDFSRYVEKKRAGEKKRPVSFELASESEVKPKPNWISQRKAKKLAEKRINK